MSLISNPNFKYVTVLGAAYFRMTGKVEEIYPILEGLYSDYRKIRVRDELGHFRISYVDEIMENLLTKEIAFDIVLPRFPLQESSNAKTSKSTKNCLHEFLPWNKNSTAN